MKLFDKAEEYNNEAWKYANGYGDLEAYVNTSRGKLARDLGEWRTAETCFNEVKDWYESRAEQSARDETLARGTWGHLAIVTYYLGQPQKAKELCLKSLEYFETGGTKAYLATLKYRLALAEEALGENIDAFEHAKESLYWYERLGMKPDCDEVQILLNRLQTRLESH